MARTLGVVSNLALLYIKAATGSAKKRLNSVEIKVDELTVNGVTINAGRDQDFRDATGALRSEQAFFDHIHALTMPIQTELMAADDFPLPVMSLIHTENTYREISPVTLSGKADISVKVAAFRAHRSGTEVILESAVTSSTSGAALVEEQSVYLAEGVRLEDTEGSEEIQTRREAVKSDAEIIEREQFKVPFPTAQQKLVGNTGRKRTKVSGDWNPIHITSVSTRTLSMSAAIACGMYTAPRTLTKIQVLPGQSYKFQIPFGAPVVLPTTTNVALAHTGDNAGATHNLTDSNSNVGRTVNIVTWDRKRKHLHFTGSVHPLKQLMRKRYRKRRALENQSPH